MYWNLKFLHMTNFFSTYIKVIEVTNMRYGNVFQSNHPSLKKILSETTVIFQTQSIQVWQRYYLKKTSILSWLSWGWSISVEAASIKATERWDFEIVIHTQVSVLAWWTNNRKYCECELFHYSFHTCPTTIPLFVFWIFLGLSRVWNTLKKSGHRTNGNVLAKL